MKNSNNTTGYVLGGIVIAGIVLVLAIVIISYAKTEQTTFTVSGKESVATGDSGHEYRVYTDHGTFKVGDSWVHPRFNSSDVYGALKEGTTYNCKVYGWRAGFISAFKNIISCKAV